MKARKLSLALIALSLFYATGAHATGASSSIRFSGLVYAPASASVAFSTPDNLATIASKQVYPLRDARTLMPSDLLDYFAAFASAKASVVSVSYQ